MKDVALWTQITDLRIPHQGPALGFTAKPAEGVDPLTGNAPTGVEVLVQELHTRFGRMTQLRAIETVEYFMTFKRKSGESSDSVIVRFEETYRRANREGGVTLNACSCRS
eukprot:2196435-Amphidinium_carterae.1